METKIMIEIRFSTTIIGWTIFQNILPVKSIPCRLAYSINIIPHLLDLIFINLV